jgi:hypothetical protein
MDPLGVEFGKTLGQLVDQYRCTWSSDMGTATAEFSQPISPSTTPGSLSSSASG